MLASLRVLTVVALALGLSGCALINALREYECTAEPRVCVLCQTLDGRNDCDGGDSIESCVDRFSCLRGDSASCGLEFGAVTTCKEGQPSAQCLTYNTGSPCHAAITSYETCKNSPALFCRCFPDALGCGGV